MSITFEKQVNYKTEEHSAGSLLLGALFGGLTSEAGQMADMAMDTAEVASEFHQHQAQKQENKPSFTLGQKKSLNGAFASGVANTNEKPEIQTRYLTPAYVYAPKPGMGMGMAA